ncbi:MFS transporter [Actinospica durhamensis]|uniref:MFS transporter n=1 Tax=Actinospica durhamensis TaxID=1508375 RepID=A0A941IP22_9ACTN|nr:MFS transporter [Actinospica durhamensis]MBR7832662.1 MFS transporter [Actinospica durhamensis]
MLMEGKPNTRRDRVLIGLVFAVHGTVTGTFASRLPWTALHVHATVGSLGLVLITPTVGALAAMPATGSVVHRLGPRGAMRVLLALWTAALALPGLMPNVGLLAVALACYGASAGAADVVMNGYAVRIEERAGKSIMSGLHGMWSVGGIVGGLFGALCAGAGISALPEFLVTSLILTVIALCATSLLPVEAAKEGQIRPPRFALPAKAVLGIGIVGFCAVFAEGSGSDWSAVYLTGVAHASAAVGAYCVTGFAATMALGRLLGDAVVRRFGPVATVRVGGAIAAAGAVLVVLARQPAVGIAGFAALGLGIATVVPLAFAAAGRRGGDTESSVAGIATITYTSGLLAGPSIGALGTAVSLSFAFGVVAVLGCAMALGAGALRPRT